MSPDVGNEREQRSAGIAEGQHPTRSGVGGAAHHSHSPHLAALDKLGWCLDVMGRLAGMIDRR